jgi:hypothetical protein
MLTTAETIVSVNLLPSLCLVPGQMLCGLWGWAPGLSACLDLWEATVDTRHKRAVLQPVCPFFPRANPLGAFRTVMQFFRNVLYW